MGRGGGVVHENYHQNLGSFLHRLPEHGVQHRMISVVNVFVFLRFLFFALLLLYVT